jgi:hypothetical protein
VEIVNKAAIITDGKPKQIPSLHLLLVTLKVTNFGGHTAEQSIP